MSVFLFWLYLIALMSMIIGVAKAISDTLDDHHDQSVFADVPEDSFFGENSWVRKNNLKIFNIPIPKWLSRNFLVFTTDMWHLSNTIGKALRYGIYGAMIYFPHISVMLDLKESLLLICAIYISETLTFHALYTYILIKNVDKRKKILAYIGLGLTVILPYIMYYFLNK